MIDLRSQPLGTSASQLKDAYERLRTPMLESPYDAARRMGYGLIVQRGLLVWMRTWSRCTPPASLAPRPSASAGPLPPGLERDLVSTLVSLILEGRSNDVPQSPSFL